MSVYTWVLSQAGGKFVGVLPHKIRVVYIYTFLIRSSLYMRTYLRLGKLYLDIILKKKIDSYSLSRCYIHLKTFYSEIGYILA